MIEIVFTKKLYAGNLGADVCTTMIDVAFARQLQHNRHLLWASEGLHPDLGGSEGDEQFSWSDPLKEPVVDNQGVYRSICVELDVRSCSLFVWAVF